MLNSAIVKARVIPNGIDLSIFCVIDKREVRASLGLPRDAKILLFTANGIRGNVWKDFQTLRRAIALISERRNSQDVLFVALGEDAPTERVGKTEMRFIPYQKDIEGVAHWYQASDIYVHAARADTFPNTVLEALACGTPVVATAVGGIPEQINDLSAYGPDQATGILVPPGDAEAMAASIERLLGDELLRQALGKNAAKDARSRFDLNRQADEYLAWYEEIIERRKAERSTKEYSIK